MFRVTVTTTTADAFGFRTGREHTFPAVESIPDYDTVRKMMIAERIRERIVGVEVRHIFAGKTVARLVGNDIVPVNHYLAAFGV